MIAYTIGLSLAPVLIGLLLALEIIRAVYRTKLIRQLKFIAYGVALFLSTAMHVLVPAMPDSSNVVVVGAFSGFTVTMLLMTLTKRKSGKDV